MITTLQLSCKPIDQLRASPLALYIGAYERYLGDRDYAPSTQRGYFGCLAHFARWMRQYPLNAENLDDTSKRIWP
jgi:hypothetical protein